MAEVTAIEPRPACPAPIVTVEPISVKARTAAALIGISYPTLRRMIATGRFGPNVVRLTGRSHVYLVDELRRWLEAGAPPADRWRQMNGEERL